MEILQEGHGELIGWHDPDENRQWVRENKPRELVDKRMTVAEAVVRFVHDGDFIASGGFGHVRVSMAAIYEIIRRRHRARPALPSTTVYDPAAARALLDRFGYRDRDGDGYRERPDGSPLTVVRGTLPESWYREADTLWKKNMDAIGIRMRSSSRRSPNC